MKIAYSAPAKVILSGEHAVVYGKPALVSAINLRLKFSLTNFARSYKDGKTNKEIYFINQKVKKYLNEQKIKFVDRQSNYKIESEIPIGRGLGSSAALSVAVVAAFLEFYTGRKFDKKTINELAYKIEKHFHKNPSGVDNIAACFGGLISFQINIKKNLDFKVPKNIEEKLFLIDSGKPKETTKEMVNFVATQNVANIFEKIEITTKAIIESIKSENIDAFKKGLADNEKLLEDLGVVSDKTKKLLSSLSKFGVGKVTGAGGRKDGSGFILFFADDSKKLIKYLSKIKILFYKFIPDNKGLRRISTLIN
ncbi:MAG: Mevalonate kinase [Candidatus Roizmanbacteria bacterium GW2011_GWC2_34_23]|uniref:mevalonate kinase n=1 Tax=Candidatus Roizmanbacteria bacterium GW2011_GWC2_34_23 TaxID=1618484 RepID=A0A0G0B931_9BACT|nr:MAG: Mevalonate kinase [Candidatus Roizmanbacteria bacterium GW2011_GWC2_34_23]